MKTVEEWAKEHLISQVPADLPVWHWTRAAAAATLRERLQRGGSLTDFTEGATGRGLYVSLSAIDNIDKGDEVIYAVVPAGTRVLMVDADLFGFGVQEIFVMLLEQMGWSFRPPSYRGQVDPESARPPKVTVPRLLEKLALPGCANIFGFHVALMLRDSSGLRFDPTIDAARTVAEYVQGHPEERPMLAPREQVYAWLQQRVPGFVPPAPTPDKGRAGKKQS